MNVLQARISGRLGRALRASVPVLVFALTVALLQWVSDRRITTLPVKVVGVTLLITAAIRILPWDKIVSAVSPRSRAFAAVLFFQFIVHFAGIMTAETRSVLAARRLAVPHRYGGGWFRSLIWALASIFRNALIRAERFYAALWLRGMAE